jgi:hypothetical protein
MNAYLGFAADLRRLLPLAEEYADDVKAAEALIPGLDAKTRDTLAAEHLATCFRREHGARFVRRLPQEIAARSGKGNPQVNRTDALLAELGVTAGDVRAWGVSQGLCQPTRGRVPFDLVEMYALAHPDPLFLPREAEPREEPIEETA